MGYEKHIDLRFKFRVTRDDHDHEETYLDFVGLERVSTDVSDEDAAHIQEKFAQSDSYWVDTSWGIIEALAGGKYTPR